MNLHNYPAAEIKQGNPLADPKFTDGPSLRTGEEGGFTELEKINRAEDKLARRQFAGVNLWVAP